MPVVPASVVSGTTATPSSQTSKEGQNIQQEATRRAESSRILLNAQPGINEIITIAKGHLNRIVTPFSKPIVRTSSEATTEVKDGVIYVVADTVKPVTMFITTPGSEDAAISLTLVPKAVPPKEIKILLPEEMTPILAKTNVEAERFEVNQPYVETLTEILRTLAKGEVPPGYGISNTKSTDNLIPTCLQDGVNFSFNTGQKIDGGKYIGYIGVAENISASTLEMQENSCVSDSVVAVSTYPHFVVEPKQKTEIYVIMKRQEPNYIQKRRSLVSY